ncbi:MAG: hypothetical protein LBM08_11045, partial [Dysgonamonadaceae bacterium]|nr:hypothetical protein [Dysgonamonadaceae bacterium]
MYNYKGNVYRFLINKPGGLFLTRRSLETNVVNLRKIVSRHCERSEAIQLKHTLWIASGFAF